MLADSVDEHSLLSRSEEIVLNGTELRVIAVPWDISSKSQDQVQGKATLDMPDVSHCNSMMF